MSDSIRVGFVERVLQEGAALRTAFTSEAPALVSAAGTIVGALRAGGKVLVFGNGGSAADAQHLAAELVGRFVHERAPLAAVALTVDTSALTAIANDYGYAHVFERQIRALGRPGDVAVALSTSGRSESVLRAARAARELGMKVVGLTGAGGRAFTELCDVAIVAPSTDTARIQELHVTACHILCAIVEADMAGVALPCAPP